MIGSRLNQYEITDKLGEGGMGAVYRAKDTRLGREVAIKVLPELFSSDPERVSRFEREARVLASLNHPNVAHVYGFEEHDGTHFLAMELASGQTLADLLSRGALEPELAVAIAIQIAQGLEAAHEQSIVHRDLKPGNIQVEMDGSTLQRVKVLDFGLAKADPGTPQADLTRSPTLTEPTAAGVLMGTAAYMAPEQARGQAADSRSDIWAFGCVLYEMLMGRATFAGESVSDILAAVLREEPGLEAVPGNSAIRRVLKRCLTKDPRARWHHMADVRLELEEALLSTHEDPEASQGVAASHSPRGIPRVLPWALAAAAGTVRPLGVAKSRGGGSKHRALCGRTRGSPSRRQLRVVG